MEKLPPGPASLSTDADWEAWGRRDPYFGVITQPRFRSAAMTEEARDEFFDSGRQHADYVLAMIRAHIAADFAPRSILDFGCGVGRVLVSFAALAPNVMGLDVSASMLAEARRNCDARGHSPVRLRSTDDELSGIDETFDLVHSYIVLQHIAPERVRVILDALLRHLAPGGVGAVHFTYSKARYVATHGLPPPAAPDEPHVPPAAPEPEESADVPPDPDMQMNSFPATLALFAMQGAGIRRFHAEFTDHGGELGVFLFFQKPAA